MLILNYTKEGCAVSDFAAEETVLRLYEGALGNEEGTVLTVSTENIISAARALVAEEVIDYSKLQIQFDGRVLEINEYGKLAEWPKGFCDFGCSFAERNIRGAIKRRKEKRGEQT